MDGRAHFLRPEVGQHVRFLTAEQTIREEARAHREVRVRPMKDQRVCGDQRNQRAGSARAPAFEVDDRVADQNPEEVDENREG